MTQTVQTRIEGEFTGYNDGAIFKLANGEVWQQKIAVSGWILAPRAGFYAAGLRCRSLYPRRTAVKIHPRV
jgi:hypothetical protein